MTIVKVQVFEVICKGFLIKNNYLLVQLFIENNSTKVHKRIIIKS